MVSDYCKKALRLCKLHITDFSLVIDKTDFLCIKYHNSGEGDTGDVWKVVCSGMAWARDESVSFKHVDTGVFLGVSGRTFGRPIHGQMEIIGLSMPDSSTK